MEGALNGTRKAAYYSADRECASADRSVDHQRKTTPAACKEAGFTERTYYRWRKEYGGLKVDQAKRLKELKQGRASSSAWLPS
jgi:hypothetical protein